MKQSIIFIEVQGGEDKGEDGYRKDTMPMVEALRAKGWEANTVFYDPERAKELRKLIKKNYSGYVSRANPGAIPGGDKKYFKFLRKLSDDGVVGMSHPDTMITFGSKDSLCKLSQNPMVPDDTTCYHSVKQMREQFPISAARTQRVIKQNRGSTGNGIWHVRCVDERDFSQRDALPLDAKMRCVEAVDNHAEEMMLIEFIDFCEQYLTGEDGLVVDMQFLPRIKEGELRILMVGNEPVFVVHKVPANSKDAFSATLFSGAKYSYDTPSKWPELVELVTTQMPAATKILKVDEIPLLWTADFILDNDPDGKDRYMLGEINCSCVGFTTHLDRGIQDLIANEVIRQVQARSLQHLKKVGKRKNRPVFDTLMAAMGLGNPSNTQRPDK